MTMIMNICMGITDIPRRYMDMTDTVIRNTTMKSMHIVTEVTASQNISGIMSTVIQNTSATMSTVMRNIPTIMTTGDFRKFCGLLRIRR